MTPSFQLIFLPSQHVVSHRVPVEQHAVGSAQEAATEHGVRVALEDRLEQGWIVARVVLEVGVLHQDHVAAGFAKAALQRRALAAILVLEKQPHLWVARRKLLHDLAGAVRRAVVDYDDLSRQPTAVCREHAAEQLLDPTSLVVDRDHDGKLGKGYLGHDPTPEQLIDEPGRQVARAPETLVHGVRGAGQRLVAAEIIAVERHPRLEAGGELALFELGRAHRR